MVEYDQDEADDLSAEDRAARRKANRFISDIETPDDEEE